MKNKSKLFNINIFLSLIIFIGLNSYSINIFAEDDEKASSSEEITDDASPKKPKGIPGKKKEYKTIDEFLEDGEYISIDGFMNVLHETENFSQNAAMLSNFNPIALNTAPTPK